MKNDYLLCSKNGKSSIRKFIINRNMIEYKSVSELFDGVEINRIIKFVNAVQDKYSQIKIPIHFNLGNIIIQDKLTYVMFECICNYLIETCSREVYVTFITNKEISTEGITSSPLLLLRTGQKDDVRKFRGKFKKEMYKSHYRKITEAHDLQNPDFLSLLMSDIDSFLKAFSVKKDYREGISEVIVELTGNALEHAVSDCLIDLDVTEPYNKKDTSDIFYGINITIINFSEKILGSSLAQKIVNKEVLNERHMKLADAYNIHKEKYFSSDYLESDFYNIASFQHKISGRLSEETTGGTGLTKLIGTLEERSDAYRCYVITGNRAVWFLHDYLSYNDDGWIGFNEEKDFLRMRPSKGVVTESHIFMPGTAYNLNFVMKKEERDYGE